MKTFHESIWFRSLLLVLVVGSVSGLAVSRHNRIAAGDDQGNTQYVDNSIRPQDEFYRYVNGKWLKTVRIPDDKARDGVFYEINDKLESQLKDIVAELAKQTTTDQSSEAQKVRDLYAGYMDEARLEQLGYQPLQSQFALVDSIQNAAQLPTVIAQLMKQGINVPMVVYIHPDNRDSTHYAPDVYQTGLELPDRDYYLKDGEDGSYKKIREAYEQHIATMFKLAGLPQPEQSAKSILALETALAQAQWDKVTNRDPVKTYNKYTIAQLDTLAPQFDWNGYLQNSGLKGKSDFLLISQPSYITAVAKLQRTIPLSNWQLYLKWKVLTGAAPYLSKAFVEENFAFHGKAVRGTPENRARWKRGLDVIEGNLGEALGKLYVARHFPEQNKRQMLKLVNNLLAAYRESIDHLEWMGDATRQQAKAKLAKLVVKIGYPDKWRDYSALRIDPNDLWGNLVRSSEYDYQYQLDKLGKPIDRTEWHMTPQTINAYYNPEMNEIVFPAAILQPPLFNMHADDAWNYGAIGAVIGHEISHGFDDQGSQFDADGNLRNWWTAEDHANFEARTKKLIDQYSKYESVPGYHINGQLTLGENIADVSGLAISLKAYHLSLNNQPAPVINGLTGDQRFFMSFASSWRSVERDKESIRLATIDPHSPPRFRVSGSVVNLDAFYKAFDVKSGDKMYVPPEQRTQIW